MAQNFKTLESKDSLKLKGSDNKTIAKISLNEYISKEDAESFLNDIKKHINIKQANEMQEKMQRIDELMQKCDYQLEELYKLYDSCDDKFEKELIYAEIRSIEILNTIKIENLD